MSEKLKYGNWIRKRVLIILGVCASVTWLLAFLPLPNVLRVAAGIIALIFSGSFLYPLYAYRMFSPQGGNMQAKIYNLIIESLGRPARGKVLDIGTGNGVLAVKLAQCFPGARVTGMDYWGSDWEYAKTVCDENARSAGVSERVNFVKGDAAALEFADGEFDAIVSNLTFHEVKSIAQKSEVVKEALRALKPGGVFAFVDYFYESRYYGHVSDFEARLAQFGLSKVTLAPIDKKLNIPTLLKHPKALGRVGILYGQKVNATP
jgi:SAM-dependent methyltransferase